MLRGKTGHGGKLSGGGLSVRPYLLSKLVKEGLFPISLRDASRMLLKMELH